ncbi:MAG: hypothetical protein WC455_17615 [Dehalococcoidia bacterium]|jgi:hypothetical protein
MNEITKRMMTDREARECVEKINADMNNIRSLVLELYEREGWAAMGYQSWRECVVAEFKQGQSYLYSQLASAYTERNISAIAEKTETIPESQLRPLAKLRNNPEKQKEAWQQAVATAPEGKVTAAHVYKIVKGMTMPEKPAPVPKPQEPSDAMAFAAIAISQLERIHPKDPKRSEALSKVERWIQNHKGGKS